jgi:hypothetical protein
VVTGSFIWIRWETIPVLVHSGDKPKVMITCQVLLTTIRTSLDMKTCTSSGKGVGYGWDSLSSWIWCLDVLTFLDGQNIYGKDILSSFINKFGIWVSTGPSTESKDVRKATIITMTIKHTNSILLKKNGSGIIDILKDETEGKKCHVKTMMSRKADKALK